MMNVICLQNRLDLCPCKIWKISFTYNFIVVLKCAIYKMLWVSSINKVTYDFLEDFLDDLW